MQEPEWSSQPAGEHLANTTRSKTLANLLRSPYCLFSQLPMFCSCVTWKWFLCTDSGITESKACKEDYGRLWWDRTREKQSTDWDPNLLEAFVNKISGRFEFLFLGLIQAFHLCGFRHVSTAESTGQTLRATISGIIVWWLKLMKQFQTLFD